MQDDIRNTHGSCAYPELQGEAHNVAARNWYNIVCTSVFLLVISIATLLLIDEQRVLADGLQQPSLPTRFYGTVTLNDNNIPTGTLLSASIKQRIYATTVITLVEGISAYVIDIPGDDPGTPEIDGGRNGDVVFFTIPGYSASQSGIWQSGAATMLNLTLALAATATPFATSSPPPIVTPVPTQVLPISIPEPASFLLLSLGLAGLAALRSRLKQRS